MRISTKLTLAALVPAIMSIIMGIGLSASYRAVDGWHQQQSAATQLSADVNELSDLARVYVLRHEERPRLQFLSKHAKVMQLLEQADFDSRGGRAHVADLKSDLEYSRSLFLKLVSNYETGDGRDDRLFNDAEQRLSGQLFIRLRGANDVATQLVELIARDIVAYQQRFIGTITGMMVLAAMILTAALLGVMTSITRGLVVLSTGTDRIGAGDLDHRISLNRKDELGELSRSFDRMTTRLKSLIVSRAQLEREVEARMLAQERVRREAQASSTLAEISASLATMRNMDEEMQTTLSRANLLLGASGAILVDRVGNGWLTRQSYGMHEKDEPEFHSDDVAPALEEVLETRALYVLHDISDAPDAAVFVAAKYGYRSFVAAPLVYRGSVVGALVFFFAEPLGELPDAATEFLGRLAYVVSVSLENARLLQAEREARREAHRELDTTSLLLQAANSLARWTDVRGLLQQLAEVVHEATTHTRTTVTLWHEQSQTLEVAAYAGEEPIGEVGHQFEYDLLSEPVRRLLDRGEAGIVDYDALDTSEQASREHDARLLYLSPIMLGERLFGFVSIDDCRERREFTSREIQIVEAIASQAAAALENARLYEAEHDIAERLQSAMLAMPDRISGIEFEHLYRSASESARVGGDFYDLFEMNDNLVGITVGDIAGKGLNAAVLTSLVKNSVRAHAMEKGSRPGDILTFTNEVVYRSTQVEAFATAKPGLALSSTARSGSWTCSCSLLEMHGRSSGRFRTTLRRSPPADSTTMWRCWRSDLPRNTRHPSPQHLLPFR